MKAVKNERFNLSFRKCSRSTPVQRKVLPPINFTSHKISSRNAGFSLIEILIALVIIAVIVSVSTIAFGDKKKDELEKQARKFYLLMQQAQDETLLRGIDIGIRVEPEKYFFYLYDVANEKWLPINEDEFFTEKEIPEILEIKLVVDGSSLFAVDEDDVEIFEKDIDLFKEEGETEEEQGKKEEPPQIYILSSGEMSDFKMAFGWTDDDPKYYVITGTMIGDLTIEGPLEGNLQIEVTDNGDLNL